MPHNILHKKLKGFLKLKPERKVYGAHTFRCPECEATATFSYMHPDFKVKPVDCRRCDLIVYP